LAWNVEYTRAAEKQLARIDRTWQQRILDYMDDEVAALDDPRVRGKALTGEFGGFWRYRIGDYRLICSIDNAIRVVLVIKLRHRRDI
jgi:mRNA interferase RelE/StbE